MNGSEPSVPLMSSSDDAELDGSWSNEDHNPNQLFSSSGSGEFIAASDAVQSDNTPDIMREIISDIEEETRDDDSLLSIPRDSSGGVSTQMLLEQATAAAVMAAESNLDTDSVLSEDEGDHEQDGERENQSTAKVPPTNNEDFRRMSVATFNFIQEASIESPLTSMNTTARSSNGNIDSSIRFEDSLSDSRWDAVIVETNSDEVSPDNSPVNVAETQSERMLFEQSSSVASFEGIGHHHQHLVVDLINDDLSLDSTSSLVCKSTTSVSRTGPSSTPPKNVKDILVATEIFDEQDLDSLLALRQQEQNQEFDEDSLVLYHIFSDFSTPAMSLASARDLLQCERNGDYDSATTERRRPIPLPKDIIVNIVARSKVLSIVLCRNHHHLLRIPMPFLLSFFRILVRLLTNETDEEYNEHSLLSCDWREQAHNGAHGCDSNEPTYRLRMASSGVASDARGSNNKGERTLRLSENGGRDYNSRTDVHIFAMVRLQQCGLTSTQADNKNDKYAARKLLRLFDLIKGQKAHRQLLSPVTRLLGLTCSTGVSERVLRRMLSLASSPISSSSSVPPLARLLMVRALQTATDGASRSIFFMGKASLNHFFSFGGGKGLSRTISGLSAWPFRNDFGMAVWFRAETFVNTRSKNPILLSVRAEDGGGIEISLMSLDEDDSNVTSAAVLVVSIYDSDPDGMEEVEVQRLRVPGCILIPRVWYHVAVRHTRSRMKGVFSLSTRQQVSIMLDGKVMLTEPLSFPKVSDEDFRSENKAAAFLQKAVRRSVSRSGLSLTVALGVTLEGQTGSLYLFHENVSDATLRALYDVNTGTAGTVIKASDRSSVWDSRHGDIVKKARLLDVNIKRDDAEEIVVSQRRHSTGDLVLDWIPASSGALAVMDMGESEEQEIFSLPTDLSRSAFSSKLFLVWDPSRTVASTAIELHIGAHVKMWDGGVQSWQVDGSQDVISSLGGVQALIPLFQSLLCGDIEKLWQDDNTGDVELIGTFGRSGLWSTIPDLLRLVASFVQDHGENAREMLRCGGIDVIEHFILTSRKVAVNSPSPCTSSLFGPLSAFPKLSRLLVDSLFRLNAACSHYIGLETKVFSRLLFNVPLWLSGVDNCLPVALDLTILPVLSTIAKANPDKVRDCIGIKDLVFLIKHFVSQDELQPSVAIEKLTDANAEKYWRGPLTAGERSHMGDILIAAIFEILASGTSPRDLSPFLNLLSYCLYSEWDESSQEMGGKIQIVRTGPRLERYMFAVKGITVLLMLLQMKPAVPNLFESFAHCCGSVEGAAGWILCAVVNSFDDMLRALGVRCVVAFVEKTSKTADTPLSVGSFPEPEGTATASAEGSSTNRRIQSILAVGKGLAGMGPGVRSIVVPPSGLTARVTYKLLWHLLKGHRSRIGKMTFSSLIHLIADDTGAPWSSQTSKTFLLENFVLRDDILINGYRISPDFTQQLLGESRIVAGRSLREGLAISTVMRLLRYLSSEMKDHLLADLLRLSQEDTTSVATLSNLPDWQPCLFHLISETVERFNAGRSNDNGVISINPNKADLSANDQEAGPSSQIAETLSAVEKRLDLCLDLYAALLGHSVREGGDKALHVVEDAASLQRVCLNGQDVFFLIMSRLISNLADHGTILLKRGTRVDEGEDLLKKSARLVTDAILSNGTEGLDMKSAVRCWRSLRHISAVAVSIITKSGFGVSKLFDYRDMDSSAIDIISGGLNGIRLSDTGLHAIAAQEYRIIVEATSKSRSEAEAKGREIHRRLGVTLASQVLSLLDAFIFPDSLDASLPQSQLHGLDLVRNCEPRLTAQGPVIASTIRLSLLLLCHLEPCGMKLLQGLSRLRCLLHWALELIREATALEGYSAVFHKLTAPLDRLILATVLQCHRTLGRCSALLAEVEASSYDKYFRSKDSQKKYLKRILRAALELQGVVSVAFRGRNEVLRAALTSSAYEALRESLESPKPSSTGISTPSMRNFLWSGWVTGFQDVIYRGHCAIPEQIDIGSGSQSLAAALQGALAMEELYAESSAILDDFEKALNGCFEKYLQAQRKWAETDLVRDLEYQGDETVKRLAAKHRLDLSESSRASILRTLGAGSRWRGIERKVSEPWNLGKHWKLARHTDRLGQRVLLVRNRNFNDHANASYELMLGKEWEKEENAREARLRQKEQLAEVMRRNIEAIVPYDATEVAGGDEEDTAQATDSDTESSMEFADPSGDDEDVELLPGVRPSTSVPEEDWDKIEAEDVEDDAWAKAFIWSDFESVVARFESVTLVTLQYLIEGKLLLTTHGLYFRQISEEISVMSKEPSINQDAVRIATSEGNDRRWRLSRLTEVLGRRYMLRAQALELFFSDSHELFLNFSGGTKERDRFHAKLRNSCKTPMLRSPKSLNPRNVFKRSRLAELWKRRRITNFQYLMELNKMAGRTFNDIMQYPVFPWILSDYTSDTIDLNDSRVYRDLTKPIGALNPNRLAQLLERYNEFADFGLPEQEKFLYGSHYSSPGVVLHFLIRQEPFTSMAIELQSGRFDCPDRLFFDISESWKSCLTLSSDMKELVPEFFCLPEMFLNTNNFPLGRSQSGRPIDNVTLPPWAKGSPYEFVRIHRMALESEFVSHNLNHWIDLIFGYKQRGPESEAAHNVFHYLTYEGAVDLDKITNEVDRAAAESQIQNFGQTPSQVLVKEPHPCRCSVEESWKPLVHSVSSSKRLRCYTPSKQFAVKKNAQGQRSAVVKIQAFSDSVSVVYDDLSVGSYKWARTNKGWRLRPDKIRHLPRPELSRSRSVIKRGTAVPPSSSVVIGNWSVAFTIGGNAKEGLRQKSVVASSRLIATKADSHGPAEASGYVVSCGYWDNEVKVHSLGGCRLLCGDNGGHRGPVSCLAMGEDCGLMVSGGMDGTCRIWVVDHADMAVALSDGYVQTALGSTNDGEQLLSCCRVLWGHETSVTCVDLSSDLDVIVSGDAGGNVCVHTVRLGEFIRSFRPPHLTNKQSGVRRISLHKHGTLLVHMEDCGLHTYTVNGVRLCSKDAGEKLNDMILCSGGGILVTGGDRCQMQIRNSGTLEIISMLDLSRHGPIRCISLTPEELNPTPQVMFIGSDDGMVTIVDQDPSYLVTQESF